MTITFDKYTGHITETCKQMCDLAREKQCSVTHNFNGVQINVLPGDEPERVQARWNAGMLARQVAYEASPEYEEAERQREEFRKQASAAAAEWMLPFTVRDQAAYDLDYNANKDDGYGACTLRYGARWANMMEAEIANGLTVAEAAEKTQFLADKEGITGLMHGCATSFLYHCWIHADELLAWRTKGKS